MSLRFPSEELANLRHDVQLLIERAGDQESQLDALVAANDGEFRRAKAAVSLAAVELDAGEVRHDERRHDSLLRVLNFRPSCRPGGGAASS